MTKIFYSSFIIFILSSCGKTPAGFWTNFRKDLLIQNVSEQGPDGGCRAMLWSTPKQNTFDSTSILGFANKNGWRLTKTYSFSRDSVSKWIYSGKHIFPLSNTGFDPYASFNNSTYLKFPRWINSDLKVYQFKTTWIAIDPGSDRSTDENGFVLVNDSATKMSVYHIWGE